MLREIWASIRVTLSRLRIVVYLTNSLPGCGVLPREEARRGRRKGRRAGSGLRWSCGGATAVLRVRRYYDGGTTAVLRRVLLEQGLAE